MIGPAVLVGICLIGANASQGAASDSAADVIRLRDGSIVKGIVTSGAPGPRNSVEFLVRRAWALNTLKTHAQRWDRATAALVELAVRQRRKRLEAWRRERSSGVAAGTDDRILAWIDRELARPSAAGKGSPSTLIPVRLPRYEVRDIARQPAAMQRMLALAWICNFPEPESMPVKELKDALEARGYAVEAVPHAPAPSLERLLPPAPESDAVWLARRAATELTVDAGLRFLRFQDTVLPDATPGDFTNALGLTTALSELKRLLDPDQGPQTDPLAEKLKSVAARGRVGAALTRLEIQADLSAVTVESTLWVRDGERWFAFGSRTGTVRPDDLGRDAGKSLEDDPQVQGAFKIAEMLGLGAVSGEIKGRSLRTGAATEKALGIARSAFNQDLEALALPVLEPGAGNPAPAARP